ncbi:MAG: hypothetical protein ACM3XO_12655 [Bacteroidota bacterium]
MRRAFWISILILLIAGLAWMVWIRTVNTRVTELNVQVASNIEKVTFYQAAKPLQPVAEITPLGEAKETPVILQNSSQVLLFTQGAPAQYYFVVEQDGQRYQSPMICCETGVSNRNERLIIRGLADWEKPGN